jgi:hypothetical protein
MVGMVSLVVLSLIGVLHVVLNTRVEGVIALSLMGATVYNIPFMAIILLQQHRGGFLVVVPVVVALIGTRVWIVLTPLLSRWLATGFTILVPTPVLSRLFTRPHF